MSVITVLLVVFLIITLDVVMRRRLSYIVTTANDSEDCIEAQLRILIKQNPNSEIIVIDKTQSDETQQILNMLAHDFPEVHIVKADSN